ncbi:MAG TPA: alpha-glucan family phosphorylase [Gemmatimonadales bacterium]
MSLPALPPRIAGLADLARNLSWSWHREARALFRTIDELLWRDTQHNPIRLLREIDPASLGQLATDPAFLAQYDAIMAWMATEGQSELTWFGQTYPELRDGTIAYFCAEFGLHNSVPIYSGGLGVLAGDHCKASSDLGVPLVGLGLFYQKGYFDQRIRPDGWQEDGDEVVDPENVPLSPLVGAKGAPYLAVVRTFDRPVYVRTWGMRAGRVLIYLLDTNLEENHPEDRNLLNKLYGGGEHLRLRQEWILGAGGVRVLRALGRTPAAWHANEGHASFMLLERVRELVLAGQGYEEAVAQVRRTSVFTTHTPVPAGHDTFDPDEVAQCTGPIWDEMGISREQVLELAAHPAQNGQRFDMTVLAMTLSGRVNAVSRRHGEVARRMWAPLWPGREEAAVPIGTVTNGVHLATWMANPMMALLDRHLGSSWGAQRDDPGAWERVRGIDAGELWRVHIELRDVLWRFIREDARRRFAHDWKEATQVVGAGALLDFHAFTIGFARRFASYKRANLVFRDPERLHKLLVNPRRPVQLLIAGKAHPADTPGKEILQVVYGFTHDPFYEGRVAFLEDYGMHPAHLMVQGVDLWLNLPRPPLEASGTSGMKAGLNGVPQLSTLDGWWEEGYDGTNGWTLPGTTPGLTTEEQDAADADALYRLLEDEIVPLFYDRDARGVPQGWVERMRDAIRVAASRFTADRMVREYAEEYYTPALRGEPFPDDPPTR